MSKPEQIIEGLGGPTNIKILEPCITRLRVEVNDPSQVNEAKLKEAGAYGVVQVEGTVQVVVGPEADHLAREANSLL
ncbi:PTS glucose/sucrose transporter subunit IIB [Scrofimicrobium sp. R131]|uniref:PTS glucose/sucrose transporter subunit IIB n=1 Tax=Scrofimicrobium appendicitidis TaxID=3079930 RepID=A0AAU7V5W8_9ACTO